MKVNLAIIILNWRQPELTVKTVNSVLKINHPQFDFHLFLLDNHSGDNSFNLFQKKFGHLPNISLFQSPKNLMFTAGNNFIIQKISPSKFKYTLLLNNDVELHPDSLKILLSFLEQNPDFVAVGPKIYFAPGFEFQQKYQPKDRGRVIWAMGGTIDWNNVYAQNSHIDEVDTGQFGTNIINPDYISGCCFLTQSTFLKKHPLDQDYWMYLEDVDLCQKIKKTGGKIAVVAAAKIWHFNSASSKAGGNPLHDYYLSRNRLIFGFRYARLKTKFALIRQSINQLLFSPSNWQKRGIIDFYTHRLGRGSFPHD